MKDYLHIVTKLRETPWMMTPEALSALLSIAEVRIASGVPLDHQAEVVRKDFGVHFHSRSNNNNTENGNGNGSVLGGVGILPLAGPIFGKANLMTMMSGATSLESFLGEFRQMMNDDNISSIILDIDSPGGTSELVFEVAEEIRAARKEMPIYAIANSLMGSAAYYIGSQASSLYSTPSGSVGSVGVYTVHEDVSQADAQAGKRFTYISAGKHKTEGNKHEPLSTEGRNYYQEVVDDIYDEFVTNVALGRNTTKENVIEYFGEGRMLRPNKALESGMIDGVTTFERLVNHAANQPKAARNSITIPADRVAAVAQQLTVASTKMRSGLNIRLSQRDIMMNGAEVAEIVQSKLESKELEHSEPGTGSPPEPRRDQDGSDEPDIKGGWRRDPLPVPLEDIDTTGIVNHNANAGGGENRMNEEQLKQLYEMFGVDSDEALLTAVTAMQSEHQAFNTAINLESEAERLKTQFPELYKEHIELRETNRTNAAKAFAGSVAFIQTQDGENLVKTKVGLSGLALTTIEDMHKKFAAGIGGVTEFEAAISAIMNGGFVDFKEHGSSVEPELIEVDLNATDASGIQANRMAFANVVAQVVNEPDKPWSGNQKLAIAEASRREPDLAKAYRAAAPA